MNTPSGKSPPVLRKLPVQSDTISSRLSSLNLIRPRKCSRARVSRLKQPPLGSEPGAARPGTCPQRSGQSTATRPLSARGMPDSAGCVTVCSKRSRLPDYNLSDLSRTSSIRECFSSAGNSRGICKAQRQRQVSPTKWARGAAWVRPGLEAGLRNMSDPSQRRDEERAARIARGGARGARDRPGPPSGPR